MKKRTCFLLLTLLFLPVVVYSQNRQLADSLHQQGLSYYQSGSYRQSEFYLKQAYLLYKKESPNIYLIPGIDYAEVLVSRAKFTIGVSLLKELQKDARAMADLRAQEHIENDLGWAYSKMGKKEIALQHLKKALPLAKQLQDTLRLGFIANNIGAIYDKNGDYRASLAYRKKSLHYLKKLHYKKYISIALSNIGTTYEHLSLYDKALTNYKQSLAIQKKIGDKALLASSFNLLASFYKKLGNFDKALIYYQKSLTYSRKSGNASTTASILNNIGTLYYRLGQPEKAFSYYRQSLVIKKKIASNASLAITYENMANRLSELGKTGQATAYYQHALKLRKRGGKPQDIASSLLDLSKVEQAHHNLSRSFQYTHQAFIIADSTQNLSLLRQISIQMGSLFFQKSGPASAIPYYRKALQYSQSMEEPSLVQPLEHLAFTYNYLGSDSSLYYGRQAINIIEKNRLLTGPVASLKMGFFKQYANFYTNMAAWTLKYEHNLPKAFHLIESAKARTLTDELAQAEEQGSHASLPENERLIRGQKLEAISALYNSLKKTSKPVERKKIQTEIRNKELNYAAFETKLRSKYSQYRGVKSPAPASLAKTRQICSSKTAVLEYAFSKDVLVAFFISKNDVSARQIVFQKADSASHSTLANQVLQFRRAILSKAPEDSLRALSHPIYKQLIAPFQKKLADYQNIVIVPSGILAYLPFEALSHNQHYLLSQYDIKYAPSVTSFLYISKPRSFSPQKMLAIGNSGNYKPSDSMPDLPTLGLEIKSISTLFTHKTILQNKDVTESQVKNLMQKPGYSSIHIAAHSIIDEKNSFMSGIVLDQNREKGIGNDGYLHSSEISQLHIAANLVVLSACKSGMGNIVNGEGMLGLQRSFFNAGASTVIVSLWDVYDRSTTRLMQIFYKRLRSHHNSWSQSWQSLLRKIGWDKSLPFGTSAQAMRAAKRAMLHDPAYHHPVYWAPFIVVGR